MDCFSYKSRAGNCLVLYRGWGCLEGGGRREGLSYTSRARVFQVFRRVGRLSVKSYTGIYLHVPCSSLSGLSSGGETICQPLYWNLSHRWVDGQSLLPAPCSILSDRLSGRQFPLHVLFDPLAGGESLLHFPCWSLSGRMSGGESILLAQSWHPSRCSANGQSVLHALC